MIRTSHVAGQFYEGEPDALRREVEEYLAYAEPADVNSPIYSAAVPHAGYFYSAGISAPVFKSLEQTEWDTVVIIGHEFGRYAPGIMAVLADFTAFRTPLGDIPVDMEMCRALMQADKRIVCSNQAHQQEHTIEVQLPFLQVTHQDFRIVPVLFGEVTEEHCRTFAQLLEQVKGERKLFVLSSTDLSHYPSDAAARRIDAQTVSFAEQMDADGLCQWKNGGSWEATPGVETPICSAGGLAVAIHWAQQHGAAHCQVLKRGNSAENSGDKRRCVGYASMIFSEKNNC